MLVAPDINPVAFHVWRLQVHWYGLMYVLAFIGAWWLGTIRAARSDGAWRKEEVGDLIVAGAFGAVLGGRIGYILFYKPAFYFSHPLEVLYVWHGGMSFHGGLIGVIVAMVWYARKTHRHWTQVTDFMAPLTPFGLGAGRIGNFINQELWGRVTDVPWGMVFRTGGPLPRHPSQLYEFLLEGVLLFVILWTYSRKPRPMGAVSGLFLVCYGLFRIFIEFFRVPDAFLGYLAFGWLTIGQIYSVPMVLAGAAMIWWAYRKNTGSVS
jgi:phosphatidylglycerol:prolipoprotein diacylglycerol transferase